MARRLLDPDVAFLDPVREAVEALEPVPDLRLDRFGRRQREKLNSQGKSHAALSWRGGAADMRRSHQEPAGAATGVSCASRSRIARRSARRGSRTAPAGPSRSRQREAVLRVLGVGQVRQSRRTRRLPKLREAQVHDRGVARAERGCRRPASAGHPGPDRLGAKPAGSATERPARTRCSGMFLSCLPSCSPVRDSTRVQA